MTYLTLAWPAILKPYIYDLRTSTTFAAGAKSICNICSIVDTRVEQRINHVSHGIRRAAAYPATLRLHLIAHDRENLIRQHLEYESLP